MSLIKLTPNELAAKLSVNDLAISDLDSQIKDLQARKKALTADIDGFKETLRSEMVEFGVSRIESDDKSIQIRLDAPAKTVKVTDESMLDEKFFRVKKEVDKAKLKQYLKDGPLDGAELVEGKHKLTIKV